MSRLLARLSRPPSQPCEPSFAHVIIFNQRDLRRILGAYLAYYHRSRTHLGLSKRRPRRQAGGCFVRPDHRLAGGRRLASPLRSSRGVCGRRHDCRVAEGGRRKLRLLRHSASKIRFGCASKMRGAHRCGSHKWRRATCERSFGEPQAQSAFPHFRHRRKLLCEGIGSPHWTISATGSSMPRSQYLPLTAQMRRSTQAMCRADAATRGFETDAEPQWHRLH